VEDHKFSRYAYPSFSEYLNHSKIFTPQLMLLEGLIEALLNFKEDAFLSTNTDAVRIIIES
jgi:hypothetical protein